MRRVLVALLAVIILAAVLVVVRRRDERQDRLARAEAQLLEFDDRQLTGFTVTVHGRPWKFERSGNEWRLASPVADVVDSEAVGDFLRSARVTQVTRVIEDPEALSAYGLDPPVASIRLEGVAAPVLDIGDAASTGDVVFAKVSGRPGVLALDITRGGRLARIDPNRLRESSLTGMSRTEVVGIEIVSGERSLGLERGSDGWWLTSPVRLPASDVRVDALLDGLEKSKIDQFVDDAAPDDAALGLGRGAAAIVLRGSGRTRRITLGGPAGPGQRYASRGDRPHPMAVAASVVDALPLDPKALVEPRLTKVNRYTVTRFSYRSGEASLEAARGGKDSWKTASGTGIAAEDVYGLLARLLDARTSGWEAVAMRPAPAPSATLEFEVEGGRRDRLDFLPGGRALVASLPGVVFTLAAPPPPVPGSRPGSR